METFLALRRAARKRVDSAGTRPSVSVINAVTRRL